MGLKKIQDRFLGGIKLKIMREFQLIEKIFKPLTKGCDAAQCLADDAAKISLKKNEELVISKDVMVENVHFLSDDGGFKIASKLLRVNLSDLAASGATPLYYMLGFSKTKDCDEKFLREFARGLKSVQDEFDLCLIGGDTVRSQEKFFSVTIFGKVKKWQILSRNQAKEGDLIFVSGTIGDAFIGFTKACESMKYFSQRHFFPTPRIELGKQLLAKKLSKCAIDISDGLLADLRHICHASKLDAEVFLTKIPFSIHAQKILKQVQDGGRVCSHPELVSGSKFTTLDLLSHGDDYELIFAVNPKNRKKILHLAKSLKLDLTCIGEFKKSTQKKFEVVLRNEKNQKIKIKKFGYEHF